MTLSDAQFDNGFGDPVIVVDNYQGDGSQLGSKRWQVEGLHLKTFSTEGISPPDATRSTWKLVLPATKVSATLTAKASGYHSAGYSVGSIFARIYGFGSVTGDTRSMQLFSSTFYDANGRNWHKDGDPTIGLYPSENKHNEIDTVAQVDLLNYWYGGGRFFATTSGITIPHYKWTWSGDGTPAEGYGSIAQAELASNKADIDIRTDTSLAAQIFGAPSYGMDLGQSGSSTLGKKSTVKVDVTDDWYARQDDASATDSLNIRWHFPHENWQTAAPAEDVDEPAAIEIDSPGDCGNNESIHFRWNYEQMYMANWARTGVQMVAALGWAAASPGTAWASLWAAVGVGAGGLTAGSDEASAVFDSCWNDSRSTWDVAPLSNSEIEQDAYRMVPVKLLKYRIQDWEGEEYGTSGYIGQIKEATKQFQSNGGSIGRFTRVVRVPPPPPPYS